MHLSDIQRRASSFLSTDIVAEGYTPTFSQRLDACRGALDRALVSTQAMLSDTPTTGELLGLALLELLAAAESRGIDTTVWVLRAMRLATESKGAVRGDTPTPMDYYMNGVTFTGARFHKMFGGRGVFKCGRPVYRRLSLGDVVAAGMAPCVQCFTKGEIAWFVAGGTSGDSG